LDSLGFGLVWFGLVELSFWRGGVAWQRSGGAGVVGDVLWKWTRSRSQLRDESPRWLFGVTCMFVKFGWL